MKNDIDINKLRNIAIIAHVDHGKPPSLTNSFNNLVHLNQLVVMLMNA